MKKPLVVSVSPHLHKKDSVKRIMWLVFLALVPAGIVGMGTFGAYSLWLMVLAVFSACLTEALIQGARGKKITIRDGSAALTGLLLAYNLPPGAPFWIPIVGSFFAIAIAKQAFGGLGRNIFNPALTGRVFLLLSWPAYMVKYPKPIFNVDTVTSATPLALFKDSNVSLPEMGLTYLDLFLGRRGGCIGEVAIFALLFGAVFLLMQKIISWHIPVTFIVTVGLFSWLFAPQGLAQGDVLFAILSGGVILGAFFMATDYVTSPLTRKGQLVFGVGCGLFTFIIRRWGGYPEGVSFAILIMNAFSPLIDRFTKPKVYGKDK